MTASPLPEPRSRRLLRLWIGLAIAWAVVLLLAGANVTTTRAGDAVPDWPWSFGAMFWPEGWTRVRNVFYEHGHRLLAQGLGLIIIVLAIWIQRVEPRRWVRHLGWTALALVVFQGVLGGIRVLAVSRADVTVSPTLMKVLHATFAQVTFCVLVVIACALSRWWRETERRPIEEGALSIMRLAVLGGLLLLAQLVLGALARHEVLPREVHAFFALPVALVLTKLLLTGVGDIPADVALLRRPAILIGVLLAAQVALGVWTYLIMMERDPLVPITFWTGAPVNLHLVVGAGLLGTTVAMAARAFRLYGLPTDERMQESLGTSETSRSERPSGAAA